MRSKQLLALLAFVFGVGALLLPVRQVSACGAFAAPRPTEGELAATLPFLTVEQVLVIWDSESQFEDFVRETRFDGASTKFGFVVPTPTTPEISAVKKPPFDAMRAAFPYENPRPRGSGALGGAGAGAGAAAAPPVVVLSEQRVGSFTAFTLSASDAGAFDKWLADNGFAMTNEAKPWLAHYVDLKFYFVALRFEGAPSGGAAAKGMTSETIRIRFRTPKPYYPFQEPAHAANAPKPERRLLTGWLITRDPMRPVAAHLGSEGRTWRRPWTEGAEYKPLSAELAKAVGPELRPLLPHNGEGLVVQSFRDLNVSREGIGDAVMVPAVPQAVETHSVMAEHLGELSDALLAPVIDPTLLDPDPPDAGAMPSTAPDASPAAAAAPEPRPRACGAAARGMRSPADAALVFGAVATIAALRRSRRSWALSVALLSLAVGCPRPSSSGSGDAGEVAAEAGGADKPPSSIVRPKRSVPTRTERRLAALKILAGHPPPDGEIGYATEPSAPVGERVGPKGEVQIREVTLDAPVVPNAERIVAGLRARFRMCYQKGLASDPTMVGKLVLSAVIKADGSVLEASVRKSEGISSPVGICCSASIGRAQFDAPTTGKSVKVEVKLTLVHQD